MSHKWQTMETAPKDGRSIDLLHVSGKRFVDCLWRKPTSPFSERNETWCYPFNGGRWFPFEENEILYWMKYELPLTHDFHGGKDFLYPVDDAYDCDNIIKIIREFCILARKNADEASNSAFRLCGKRTEEEDMNSLQKEGPKDELSVVIRELNWQLTRIGLSLLPISYVSNALTLINHGVTTLSEEEKEIARNSRMTYEEFMLYKISLKREGKFNTDRSMVWGNEI